jgi:hypothetical protein
VLQAYCIGADRTDGHLQHAMMLQHSQYISEVSGQCVSIPRGELLMALFVILKKGWAVGLATDSLVRLALYVIVY